MTSEQLCRALSETRPEFLEECEITVVTRPKKLHRGLLIAAVIILGSTGWAFLDLMGTPAEITQGAELEDGAYVTAAVGYLMDICGVEKTESTEKIVAYYAVAPIGDQFVVLRFPASEYDTIADFEAQTQAYLYGTQSSVPFRMTVTGMARQTDETVAGLLSVWFSQNGTWMSRSGLIAEVEDYNTYLCPFMIDTGSVGTVGAGAAVTMTAIAGALILWALAELVLLFVPSRPKAEKKTEEVRDA